MCQALVRPIDYLLRNSNELNHESVGASNTMAFVANKRSFHDRGPPDYLVKSTQFSRNTNTSGTFGGSGIFERNVTVVKKPNNYYYSHCKMSGHSLERCWKVNGYLTGYKPNNWKNNPSVMLMLLMMRLDKMMNSLLKKENLMLNSQLLNFKKCNNS